MKSKLTDIKQSVKIAEIQVKNLKDKYKYRVSKTTDAQLQEYKKALAEILIYKNASDESYKLVMNTSIYDKRYLQQYKQIFERLYKIIDNSYIKNQIRIEKLKQ